MGLSERDRAVLDLERTWWTLPGSKEQAIRERFGFSAARYYQLLAALVEDPDASAYDPLTVRRVRRMREQRRRARVEGRRAGPRG